MLMCVVEVQMITGRFTLKLLLRLWRVGLCWSRRLTLHSELKVEVASTFELVAIVFEFLILQIQRA